MQRHETGAIDPPFGREAAERLAATVTAAAEAGPILVVADAAAVGRLAPRWARDFAAAGRMHRVRVGGDPAAVAAEIVSFGAAVVVGVGTESLLAAVATAADAAGLQRVLCLSGPVAEPAHAER